MLRKNSTNIEPEVSGQNAEGEPTSGSSGVDLQRELNRLDEMIFDSLRIPFVGRTLIDEEKLPVAFEESKMMPQHQDEILQSESTSSTPGVNIQRELNQYS